MNVVSPSELALLENIAAAPSDDDPLLALATWFDSRADPRGELIRVQLEIERGATDLARRYARSQELLPSCEARWLAPIAPLLRKRETTNYHPLQLRRGVPWSLFAEVGELSEALLSRLPTIQRLELSRYHQEPVELVFGLAQMSQLKDLRLFYCDLDDRELAIVLASRLPRLSSLDLGCNRIGPDGARALAWSPLLAQLESLSLYQNRIGDDGVEALANSSFATRVRAIDLRDNGVGPRGMRLLTRATCLGTVERLQLGKNSIGNQGRAISERR